MILQVVTCADKRPVHPYYCFDAFLASLKRFGIEPIILGWGQPWRGLSSKPKLLKKAILDGTITAERILFTDAFDVVFADDPNTIPSDMAGILWNAEKGIFPDATLAQLHPPTASPFRYLNSGVSIGRTEHYLDALVKMKADAIPDDYQATKGMWVEPNDQFYWQLQFLAATVPMQLDYFCQYFQTLHDVTLDEIDLTGDRIRNTVTNTHPIVFHLNGGCKELWKPKILSKLLL